ncbi:MAG: hypothetical protein ACRD0D_00175, partial [Acidimicrobiales bacterium]
MRYERLLVEAGEQSIVMRFHPGLTIVAGASASQRDAFLDALFGALAGTRPNLHLTVASDGGRRLAFLHPEPGPRVIELATRADVTGEFQDGDGRVSLLHRLGWDAGTVRARSVMVPPDFAAARQLEEMVGHLATLDQPALWAAATRVVDAEARLAALGGAGTDGTPSPETIERLHRATI